MMLTAAVIGLGVAVFPLIKDGMTTKGTEIKNKIINTN